MKLTTSLVAVKKISSNVPRSQFAENDLNRLAELILQVEGIINPPVIRRKSLDSYEVVAGDFEYYAAARAREIDPRKGEMIAAFIFEAENEEVLKQQVELLRNRDSEESSTKQANILVEQFENLPQQVENLTTMLTQVAESVKQIQEIVFNQSEAKPVQSSTTVTQQKDYKRKTKAQLIAIASERNIKIGLEMKKDEMIAVLVKSDASQS
ncbi:MAG TPA: hypothetical protein V6D12_23005 [Candidatus Obscuribacterales bacterium]